MGDLRRVLQYPVAEHKAINALEAGKALEVERSVDEAMNPYLIVNVKYQVV